MSVELTAAERAYLIGRGGTDEMLRHTFNEVGRGVLVAELIGDKDGPEE